MEIKVLKDIPSRLKNIYDPPKELYLLGRTDLISESKIIAIVGTRQISDFGKEITAKLTKELVKEGYVIISGMALGVDSVAHWSAINNKGKTIAVLGSGVDIIYPKQNEELYFRIIESGGAIISEIPPGHFVARHTFAARNRIISGLARAVLIPECRIKSGTMVTAKLALDQGKEIFCVPGSEGTDYLIEQGASLIEELI